MKNTLKHALYIFCILSICISTGLAQKADTFDPQKAENIYAFKVKDINGKEFSLKKYEEKAVLIVNTASKCGFTPQYEDLVKIYKQYKDQGFLVLGVPANEFGMQEPGSNDEILEFCQLTYNVEFPMLEKTVVKGDNIAPLFQYLTTAENPDFTGEIKWNFEKFLIDREGKLIRRFRSRVKPTDEVITGAIEKVIKQKSTKAMCFPGAAWKEAVPESQGVDSKKLAEAVEYLKNHAPSDGIKELVIIRNGVLIWKGSNIDKVHGVWSLTKSFTSTVLGLLIDDGKATLDTKAKEYIPAMAEHYGDVTLRHFTTMTSGYRAIGDEPQGSYLHGPSKTPFIPNPKPLFSPPGSKFAYWDSAMNQFGNVLTRIAEESMEDYFKRKIADPIGMNWDQWDWGDFGEVDGLVVNGGSGNNGNHILTNARELARFGHLFLNRGCWDGKQLISAEWVDQVHKVHVPMTLPYGHPESGIDGPGMYGFNWWVNGVKKDGERKWPGVPVSTYAASGYNNNDLFVLPDWKMVVVRLGLDQGEFRITDDIHANFLKKIGESIIE